MSTYSLIFIFINTYYLRIFSLPKVAKIDSSSFLKSPIIIHCEKGENDFKRNSKRLVLNVFILTLIVMFPIICLVYIPKSKQRFAKLAVLYQLYICIDIESGWPINPRFLHSPAQRQIAIINLRNHSDRNCVFLHPPHKRRVMGFFTSVDPAASPLPLPLLSARPRCGWSLITRLHTPPAALRRLVL